MDEDFDLGGFDEAYDTSDFGDVAGDQAFTTDEMAPVTGTPFGGGNFVDIGAGGGDSIASILNPALGGGNRTNITNVGGGSNLTYDPAFAAALDISKGLDPTNNLGGTGGLMVPTSLRPQIEGEFYDPFGDKPMFYSQGEKFLQETLPGIVQAGPVARIARGIESLIGNTFSDAKEALSGGIDYLKNSFDGLSLEDINKSVNDAVSNLVPNRVEKDTNPMNMPMAAIRDEVERVDYGTLPPSPFTFGSMPDMTLINARSLPEQTMNTGIAGLSSTPVTIDRLNPIVQEIQDPSSQLPTEEDRAKRDFARDVFQAFPNQREKQFGSQDSFNQDFINRTLNPSKPNFDDEGFIKLSDVNTDLLGFGASRIAPSIENFMQKYISPNIDVKGGAKYDKEKEKFNPMLQLNYRFGTV